MSINSHFGWAIETYYIICKAYNFAILIYFFGLLQAVNVDCLAKSKTPYKDVDQLKPPRTLTEFRMYLVNKCHYIRMERKY